MIKMDVRQEKRKINKEKAKHYLTFNNLIGQRTKKDWRVDELYEKYQAGLLHRGSIHFATGPDGKVHLMDGQHFLNLILEYDIEAEADINYHECDTNEDLTTLFDQFEILRRSIHDSVKVRHEILGLDKKWPLWISEIVVSAVTMEKNAGDNYHNTRLELSTQGSQKKLTKDSKMKLLTDNLDFASFYYSIVRDEKTNSANRPKLRHMAKAVVVFMILKTYRIHKNDARIFWNRVAFGEDLKVSRPEYKLREFLIYSGRGTRNDPRFSIRIANHEIAYRTALAWNAFRKNAVTSLAYRISGSIPKLI